MGEDPGRILTDDILVLLIDFGPGSRITQHLGIGGDLFEIVALDHQVLVRTAFTLDL